MSRVCMWRRVSHTSTCLPLVDGCLAAEVCGPAFIADSRDGRDDAIRSGLRFASWGTHRQSSVISSPAPRESRVAPGQTADWTPEAACGSLAQHAFHSCLKLYDTCIRYFGYNIWQSLRK